MVYDWIKKNIKKIFYTYRRHFRTKIKPKYVNKLTFDLDNRYLIATKNGLYLIQNDNFICLLPGEYYGITKYDSYLYIFEKLGEKGRIIRIEKTFKDPKIEEWYYGLSGGCHQIDFIGNELYVTDTYNNRIIKFDKRANIIDERYPIGELKNGRDSENYGHINSIYASDNFIYLLCHNETKKTRKNSKVLKTDLDFADLEVISTKSSSAHNIYIKDCDFLICDSLNNCLKVNEEKVFKSEHFTRGLSITDQYIIIGGSEYASRDKRKYAKGALYILDHQFNLQYKFSIPSMVQEIRSLDSKEYTFSNTDTNNFSTS